MVTSSSRIGLADRLRNGRRFPALSSGPRLSVAVRSIAMEPGEWGWPRGDVREAAGRLNPVVARLTGRIVADGRKPWRLARLGGAVVDGV